MIPSAFDLNVWGNPAVIALAAEVPSIVPGVGIAWVIFLLITGPLNVVLTRRLVAKRTLTRRSAYASTLRGLGVIGVITLRVDSIGYRFGLQAHFALPPVQVLLAWTILIFAVGLAISIGFLFSRKILRRPLPPLLALLLPQTQNERFAFAGVSMTAGLVEEYVFRGFCLGALISATGSKTLSFLLVTLAFGIGHGYQDLFGMLRATLLGAILATPVLALGALFPFVVAHVMLDMTSGLPSYHLLLARWELIPGGTGQV